VKAPRAVLLSLIAASAVAALVASSSILAQSSDASITANPVKTGSVPSLVGYSGTLKDASGRVVSAITGVTFLIYKDSQGGAPLWLETQNVAPDKLGHYSVQLGSATASGLPSELFMSGEARWLAVQPAGEAEQPRVLLVAVPYAMKAADAETIGGLPPSAFVLAAPANANGASISPAAAPSATSSSAPPPASSNVTTTGGTVNTFPLFTTATNIQNSILTQTGTTAVNVAGKLNLPSIGVATTAAGTNSRPEDFAASVFNSSKAAAVAQTFQLQAEPVGNNTATPSGTLNLLYGAGTATPAETGLKISNKGLITFATGQAFPGTGKGTVISVASGVGLTGGPITGSGTLSLAANACAAGSALSALPFTCVPFATLGANTFTGTQSIAGHNLQTLIGDPGCGTHNFAGIAFGSSGFSNCQNYSMVGDSVNTYIAAPTGNIYFRTASNAVTAMTIAPSGTVDVYGLSESATSGLSGANAFVGVGGNGDTNPNGNQTGGVGVQGYGGSATFSGAGGAFYTGNGFGNEALYAQGGLAGNFTGDVMVSGAISAGTKDFKIDHPLDPANKYLVHASVESSEMMNIYTGNITTDSQGHATVHLPDWLEVLNTDFRYQLTVIGQFAQAIIGRKIENNQFEIRTSAPNVEVSWQVTGVRQDAYAKANPLVVEQEKEARLRGFYIHPELYGAPEQKQIEWARHPQMMKKMQEVRARQLAMIRATAQPVVAHSK